MQNQLSHFYPLHWRRCAAALLTITLLVLLFPGAPTRVLAQAEAPTPYPTVPASALIVVAGGHGAMLYTADGAPVESVEAGARLIATERTADGQWLYVTTADARTGWVAVDQVIGFYRLELPTTDLTISPVAATATPLPTVTNALTTPVAMTPTPTPAADVQPATTTAGPTTDSTTTAHTTMAEVTATITTDGARLNVRSGPGLGYSIIGKVLPGQAVQMIGRSQDGAWTQIALPDNSAGMGWVATRFVGGAGDLPVAAAATTVTAPAAPAPAPAATGGLTGQLVFQDRQGGAIYRYDLATGALTTLTNGFDPALSPDGSQVVFTRGGGEHGIYLINRDGSNERKIFGERELLRSPKWSPDGQWIVFSRGDEFNKCYLDEETGECLAFTPFDTTGLETGKDHIRKLARIDPNGNSYQDLAVAEEAMAPDWGNGGIVYQSGAGLQITQNSSEDANRKLYFEIKRQYHQDPDWQPNGDRIVFQQRQGSHYQIFAINQDGSGLTALTRPATALVDQLPSSVAPAWSPDGSHIVFLSNRTPTNEAGAWQLWVMNSDGSNQQQLPINVTLHYDYVNEQMVDWSR